MASNDQNNTIGYMQVVPNTYTPNNHSCPNCGYCPHCGRGSTPHYYYLPYTAPYPYIPPTWTGPTCTGNGTVTLTTT